MGTTRKIANEKEMPALDYRTTRQQNHLEMDRIKIDFMRWLLQARQNTSWLGVWGEIVAPPMAIEVSLRIANFFNIYGKRRHNNQS